ncbi:MAG: DNA-directed DNA polymerase [Candidatus Micrarchaeota archaeon]
MKSSRTRAALIEADYVTRGKKAVIRLVMKRRRFFRLYDENFQPYFYVDSPILDEAQKLIEKLIVKEKNEEVRVERVERVRRLVGSEEKEILRVFCFHPRHVPILRERIKQVGTIYEHNIPFARRYLIDKNLTPMNELEVEREGKNIRKIIGEREWAPKFNMLAFDIETYNPLGTPRAEKDPAIMVSYANENGNGGEREKGEERRARDSEGSDVAECGVITYKKINKKFVASVSDEKKMLEAFCELVKKKDAELLVGYNSAVFDLPYLKKRAEVLKTRLALGRDGSSFKIMRRGLNTFARVKGRIHIDLYPAVRFLGLIGALKVSRFNLGDAYAEMTGEKKLRVKKVDIWRMWDDEEKLGELAEYSLNDALATLEIARRVLPLEIEMAKLVKAPLFDVCGATTGQLVEMLLINEAHRANTLVPNKPSEEEVRRRSLTMIKGAHVKLPQAGIYENIAVFDFRGLYPSIIVSHNIDPSTINCKCCKPGEARAHVSPTGSYFCQSRRGLIPSVLEKLTERRAELKRKLHALKPDSQEYRQLFARSQALKILSNSFYGYLAYARSRWYSKEAGESVTAWGRHYILETARKAEESGFNVLYIDTDGIFILLGDKKKEDALRFMDEINRELPEKMELELEGFYTRGVFVTKKGEAGVGAKKKYALIGEDGRIKIRGFELVRRDWSRVARETQQRVLEAILKEGSREKAMEIVRETIKELRSGKVPLEKLVIYTQLRKRIDKYDIISPELAAAKKAIAKGLPLEEGSMISYIITRTGKTISEKAELADTARDYDANYYIAHQVLPAVMKILKELGCSEDDLKMLGTQQSLKNYFG